MGSPDTQDACKSSHDGKLRLQLDSNSDCIHVLRSMVAVMTARSGMDELRSNRVAVAVDELFANIAAHGYEGKPGRVEFETAIYSENGGQALIFDFRDYAPVFRCGSIEEIAARPQNLEQICPGGLGLKLIHSVTDHCEHESLEDGNHWRLLFNIRIGENNEHES